MSSINIAYQALPSLALEGTLGVDVTGQLSQALRRVGNDVDGFINVAPLGQKIVDDRTQRIVTAEAKATWRRQFGADWPSFWVAGGKGSITKITAKGSVCGWFPHCIIEGTSVVHRRRSFNP